MLTPAAEDQWPGIGVVVPTHHRPELLARCVAAIWAQDYPGQIDIVVVFDGEQPDDRLCRSSSTRSVRVLANDRVRGLAGARNAGIAALATDLIAFCDDDDTWAPNKATEQVRRLRAEPASEVVTCAITVRYGDRRIERCAGQSRIEHRDLLRSRMSMLHSSTFLIRRDALLTGIGPPDETIPGSQNEDWDLLLRAARRRPIAHVDTPLVDVLWGRSSYFSRQWESRVSSLQWMLRHHPEILSEPTGAARVYGQLGFGCAALGRRREALGWIARSLRAHWREPRALIAVAVVVHLVSAEFVLAQLHRRGRGI